MIPQLCDPGDLDNVRMVQAAPAIKFIKPLMPAGQKTSLEFLSLLNFILQHCPTGPRGPR